MKLIFLLLAISLNVEAKEISSITCDERVFCFGKRIEIDPANGTYSITRDDLSCGDGAQVVGAGAAKVFAITEKVAVVELFQLRELVAVLTVAEQERRHASHMVLIKGPGWIFPECRIHYK